MNEHDDLTNGFSPKTAMMFCWIGGALSGGLVGFLIGLFF